MSSDFFFHVPLFKTRDHCWCWWPIDINNIQSYICLFIYTFSKGLNILLSYCKIYQKLIKIILICFQECQDDLMTYFGLQFATVETSKLFFKYIAKEFLLPQQTLTAKWQQLANLPSIIVGSMWRRNVISSRGSTRMDFSWVQGCGCMITSWAETIFASWWPSHMGFKSMWAIHY